MITLPAVELMVCCSQPEVVDVVPVVAVVAVDVDVVGLGEVVVTAVEPVEVVEVVEVESTGRVVGPLPGATMVANGLSPTRDPAASTAR